MKKETIILVVLALFLVSCIPEPEKYEPLEERKASNITQEIHDLEEQAREQARQKISEQEAVEAQKQEQSKTAEEPKTQLVVQQQEMSQSTNALGLYPLYFMDGSSFKSNFITIVGDEAPSSYVVAVSNLMARTPGNKPTGFSMLSSEISDLSKYSAVVVGNPCNNEVIAKLMNNPSPCDSAPLPVGKGLLRLYESQNGNIAIIAAGKTDALVVEAIDAIGTEEFKELTGSETCIKDSVFLPC